MCALRDNRTLSAVSLACQYRLAVVPKRPPMRRLTRPKKHGEQRFSLELVKVNEDETPPDSAEVEEEEVFNFDSDDDCDAPPDDMDLSQRYYLHSCKDLHVHPTRSVFEGLVHEKLSCKGNVLMSDDVKAATIALVGNSCVETIVFEGNEMGGGPMVFFSAVFSRNIYITEIRIRWNSLGSVGARTICASLEKNMHVRILDLTGNKFGEEDAMYFRDLMEENSAMYELHLGHNYFREKGGEHLAYGIKENDFLRVLDLSWNHLRLEGAAAIGKALAENINLEVLNLSWNGLYLQGATSISAALAKNQSLRELDISCNRLSEKCVASFLTGMRNNTTLKKLKIGRNHLTHIGASMVLEFIKKHPKVGLDYIELGDQHVEDDFISLLKEIQSTRPLHVVFGKVWSPDRDPIGKQDATEDELALLNENAHYVLMEFMRVQKLRLVDLFHQMDKNNSTGISVAEFQQGLQAVGIPLKKRTLEKFVQACDTDKNGEIDFSELLEANRRYKEEVRRLARVNTPFETTDIGRIQKLVQKIMLNSREVPKHHLPKEDEKPDPVIG